LHSSYYVSAIELSQNPLGNEGVISIARAVSKSKSIVHLDLRSTAFRKEAANKLFKALSVNKSVTCLQIGNIKGMNRNFLAGKSLSKIEDYLKSTQQLTFLDLNGALICNEGLVYVLKGLIHCKHVKVLNLAFNNLNGGASSTVIDIIIKTSVKRLNLNQNALGSVFVSAFSDAMQSTTFLLTHLSLSFCGFISPWTKELIRALRKGIGLEFLELNEAKFHISDFDSLTWFVASMTNLRTLSLASCELGDEGVKQIGQGLIDNYSVNSLNLSWNRITNQGVIELTQRLLKSRAKVNSFDLSHNQIEVRLTINLEHWWNYFIRVCKQ
jgi:Ran GTPase-activating protein (RanGAP) involved in mRNA processing and transport